MTVQKTEEGEEQTKITDGGWNENDEMDFETAVNSLNEEANESRNRMQIDGDIRQEIGEHDELKVSYYSEKESQNIVRYGMDPDKIRMEWRNHLQKKLHDDHVEDVLEELENVIIEVATQHQR